MRVFISQKAIRDDEIEIRESGGPYADAIVIELHVTDRERVFRIFEQEAEAEGYENLKGEQSVIDRRYLYLWWD
jgi:hypothetical protein